MATSAALCSGFDSVCSTLVVALLFLGLIQIFCDPSLLGGVGLFVGVDLGFGGTLRMLLLLRSTAGVFECVFAAAAGTPLWLVDEFGLRTLAGVDPVNGEKPQPHNHVSIFF